jgi:hypothetical protein
VYTLRGAAAVVWQSLTGSEALEVVSARCGVAVSDQLFVDAVSMLTEARLIRRSPTP